MIEQCAQIMGGMMNNGGMMGGMMSNGGMMSMMLVGTLLLVALVIIGGVLLMPTQRTRPVTL